MPNHSGFLPRYSVATMLRHTWSFRRRSTNGVIIFFARDTRCCASNVTFESPFVLKTARMDSISLENFSGMMKFIRDFNAGRAQLGDDKNCQVERTTSSCKLFCRGVPVSSNRHSDGYFISA